MKETRLGKLINDVRKNTKNEDLAKRAKKLLRNWQKLIEPGKGEVLSKNNTGTSWSSSGGAHACISTPPPTTSTTSGQTGPELKNRNDFNNCYSSKVEKITSRKRKGDQQAGLLPAKISKITRNDKIQNSKQLPINGVGGSSDTSAHQVLDSEISEPLDNDGQNKIPVNAVKPHPSVLGYCKPSSTSLLQASVFQQQAKQGQTASGGQYRPRSSRCTLHSPQIPKQDAVVKQTALQAQSIPSSSPTVRPGNVDTSGLGPSPQPTNVCVQGLHTDTSWTLDLDSQGRPSNTSPNNPTASSTDVESMEGDGVLSNTEKRKRQKYRTKDCVRNSKRQAVEDDIKPVRLKDRRLTFDPVTGQIKPSFYKESCQEGDVRLDHRPEHEWSEQTKQNPPVPPSPFQQTDWKELSRSEIIQSYLSQQSNVLMSSGAHNPGANFFLTEFLKKEEHQYKIQDIKKTHVLTPELPPEDLPGVSREVTSEDLNRLHTQHWSGVNGCYDTKGNWYDWMECISLAPHGDERRLDILPYVCLD